MGTCFITMDFLQIVILLFFAYGINCRIVKDRVSGRRNKTIKGGIRQFSIEEYLEQYGYLKKPSADDENIQHSEEDRKHAIRMFQRFAGLPVSGKLNRKTVAKMKMRRCGIPDVIDGQDPTKPLEYNLDAKWSNKKVTWNVQSYSSKLSEKKQRHAFNNAFKRWNNSSGLDIRLAAADDKADINILFASGDHGDGYPFDGRGGKLAHAYPPKDGRTHFDADENWRYHSNRGTELEITATHEFGHALGLGHSMTRGSIMVPFYQKYRSGFQLHADDIAGIQSLYGPPKKSNEIPEFVDTTTKATTTTTIITTTAPTVDIDLSVCASKFHAITRGPEGFIHLFIGLKIYKLKDSCSPNESCILPGYPRPVRSVYKRAPRHIGAAAFIPDERQRTYFFKGRSIWRYTGYSLDPGYPRRFNKTLMPYKPTAAYIHKNQYADYQLYLFGGKYFWEISLDSDLITNGIMKVRKYWSHMPSSPDAIVQTRDGYIYVFKGRYYRKYDHRRVLMDKKKLKAPAWLGGICRYAPR